MTKEYYVYKHIKNEVVFYIGSGKVSNRRAYGKNSRNKKWWDFCKGDFDVVIDSYHDNKKDSGERERELIKEYKDSVVNMVSNGYNSMKGKKQSKESRAKMSAHWKKNPMTGSKNGMYGRTGEKNPNFGNGHKIAGRKNVNSKKVIDLNNNICYYSPSEASKVTGIKAESIRRSSRLKREIQKRDGNVFVTVNFRYIEEEENNNE